MEISSLEAFTVEYLNHLYYNCKKPSFFVLLWKFRFPWSAWCLNSFVMAVLCAVILQERCVKKVLVQTCMQWNWIIFNWYIFFFVVVMLVEFFPGTKSPMLATWQSYATDAGHCQLHCSWWMRATSTFFFTNIKVI